MKIINLSKSEKIINCLNEFHLTEEGMLPIFDIENNADVKESINNNEKTAIIGDSHLNSIRTIKEFYLLFKNPGVVIFDAHPDCENESDILPSLIKNGFKKENIVLVGLRSWKKEESNFIKENKIRFFDMGKLAEYGKEDLIETVMENARRFDALYISIDLDVLDPAFAPAVSCKEPGGLTSRELLFFLHKLKLLKNLKAIDIMEFNEEKDRDDITAKLAAKLIVEIS